MSVAMSFLVKAIAVIGLLVHFSTAHAQDDIWPVKGKLLGKNEKKSENVSGIACTADGGFPRSCLVIDDERQSAQFVAVLDGEIAAGDSVPLIQDRFGDKQLELDGEGVAYAGGAFYVIGSHGHPRDRNRKLDPVRDREEINAKIAASSQLIRIRVNARDGHALTNGDVVETRSSTELKKIIAADPTLKRFVDQRLDDNGVTIEGVAILGDRLFAGFRGPSLDNGQAAILSVRLDSLFEGGAPEPRLHRLSVAQGQGIRDLARFGEGLLVLAGPSVEDEVPYVVYWWNPSHDRLQRLADITKATGAGEDRKPEAILPLDQGPSGLRVLVLLDGAEEGEPRKVVIPAP
jgi:hypothetical protein